MNCPSKACVKSTNLNAHLHCLNTISIEILLISLRFQRQILGLYRPQMTYSLTPIVLKPHRLLPFRDLRYQTNPALCKLNLPK